jgi:Family of unknown function (DUF5989)
MGGQRSFDPSKGEVRMPSTHESRDSEFSLMAHQRRPSFAREMISFLLHTRKWWLAPVIIVLLAVGGLIMLGGTAAAPLIYTLF